MSTAPPAANTRQVGGNHYKRLKPEPWDVTAAWGLCFFLGNVIKYCARYREKGGIESLRKARHYLDKKIELLEQKGMDEAISAISNPPTMVPLCLWRDEIAPRFGCICAACAPLWVEFNMSRVNGNDKVQPASATHSQQSCNAQEQR